MTVLPMAAYGLYTHIQANKRRSSRSSSAYSSWSISWSMRARCSAKGSFRRSDRPADAQGGHATRSMPRLSPPLGTVLWILIAYKFHQRMIDAVTGGREITRNDAPRLYNLLENLCISRGITMPKLKVDRKSTH